MKHENVAKGAEEIKPKGEKEKKSKQIN